MKLVYNIDHDDAHCSYTELISKNRFINKNYLGGKIT